ncbi:MULTISPECIES: stage III sporulation protein AF [unclassified Paenibacillus]|uniref:stage III sporulation protein AF n=1 Tax=unclassified Paenibacillus TaxID=185978 RepID=UPI0009565158|nr:MULTISPECIES: stage III sporulation protein AF [unclassified Paenibacillus]ASS65033.1 stage III sporulation protein AF [Paenibacillus sp. RUD330]SIQ50902.1 stage III sporulation protein AF [Paenibacillus sp. RU4X]SIQ73037.1 stage III sporulation protein AF [Paenibacillus sp. RU4T]
MLGWFSSWLKDVISVILLAAIVDLLLPNKSMQRYARLVTGLIVLLVILTPLLKLAQGDIQGQLSESIKDWDREVQDSNVKMPSLDDILRKAEETSGRSRQQAAELARTKLESEVKAAVEQQTGLGVASVAATVSWDGSGNGTVSGVVVTLAAAGGNPSSSPADNGKAAGAGEVAPVDIRVDPLRVQAGDASSGGVSSEAAMAPLEQQPGAEDGGTMLSGEGTEAGSGSPTEAPAQAAAEIRRLVAAGWGLQDRQIQVWAETE